ncbi:uncharacterized protein [Nothobranchius furzeri]|uniref:uncharacterized protein isoform X2 n=1 Tax=Nothobranchius furzeri TaxID=105023 RepID=UPI0039048828
MFIRNEEVVGTPGISSRSSRWLTLGPPVREKKSRSLFSCPLLLKTYLLIIILAGHAFGINPHNSNPTTPAAAQTSVEASANPSSAAPSTIPISTTSVQTSVFYFLDVTVDVTGQKKNESEIITWLDQLFQTSLTSCLSPDTQATAAAAKTSNIAASPNRVKRQISDNLQSSFIRTDTSLLFQGIEVSCALKTEINNTRCSVVLRLNQTLPACCILQTLCAASRNSPNISVVGNRADKTSSLQQCSSNPEENSCIYSGSLNALCEESGPFYTVPANNSANCSAVSGNCSCSAYCNRSDAYYTFSFLIQDPMMNSSYISSLISTLKQTVCFDSMSSTCLSSIIASKYKNASVVCEQSATFQSCKGILGFGHEIPICSVAAAVRNVFQLEEQILFTGEVRRAAICGNLKVSNDPLDSQFTWTDSNLKPANFCTQAQNPHTLACQNGTNLIVQLDELCDASVVSTTTNPSTSQPDANVTTSQPNMTTSQPDTNVTTSQPNMTTSQPDTNVTTSQPNMTTSQPDTNVTTSQPNMTASQPDTNVTTSQPNMTTSQPDTNVTTSQSNMTTSQPDTNVTTSQPDTNFTSSQQNNNVTTSLPDTNVTTSLPGNVTTGQQDTNVTTSQQDNNVTTSLPGNVTTGQQDTNVTTSQQDNNVTTSLPDNMTTSLPSSMTTSQPYATTLSQNETAFTPKPPATTQPNTTTTTKPLQNTTRSPEKTTSADRSTATTITTTNSGNSSAESQADRLLQMTGDMSNLTSADLENLVSELEKLLSGPTVSLALGNISIHVVSNLLGASPEKMLGFSRRIIGIVDTVGLKLVVGAKAETLLSPALALSVKPADGAHFQEASFSISDPNNVQTRANSRLKRSVAAVSSIPQGSITLPSTLTQNLTSEEQNQVSRLQFNFYQKSTLFQDQALGQRKLNSGIIGASAANLSIRGLQDRVIIRLRNTVPVPANFVATCVFWDFRLKNGSGGWNSNGCIVQNTTDNETICGCNHLTSFAILLDISRQPTISLVQNTILTFITYIGCGVSAIFLSLTLLTYLAFGKLRKDIPSKILIELCFALLFLNLVFLVDAWLSLYPDAMGLCISTAWFLHYFLLVVFTWMGLEGVHMYLAIVKVFNNFMSHYMLKFSLVGWGVPMLVVIIVIAIDKNNYGLVSYGKFVDGTSDDFCWLKNDIAFYVAVVAYFCVIFVFNFIMFIIVLVQLHRVKNQNPHNNKHRTTIQDVRSVIGISILLGLTWGFAFFAWGPLNLAFMYLFAIFNSLQGFFIFVFHCAVKETVRRQWRTYLCCGRMRLLENSEWSRTATQKTTKRSPLTSVHSSHNSPRSSSFLVSNSSNGISSPFSDRTITADEDPGSDVVLNEINNQYRHQHTS